MKLRVYKTFSWQLNCSPMDAKYGGPNPMKLVAHDELQFYCHGVWYPVDVVEAEKPPNPMDEMNRVAAAQAKEFRDKMAEEIKEYFDRR